MTHKLLLADDSITIQRVIELTFAEEDIQVITVGDGQSAIDRLSSDPPDIVLADVDMPKRDGYEVAAYVKSQPALAHIPVILLTGAFEPVDQARARAAGSSDVLAKPFEPQMVINKVKQLLGKKRPDEEEMVVPSPPLPMRQAASTGPGPAAPQPPRQTPAQGGPSVSLDDYFDQLDAAFSNLQPGASAADAGSTAAEQDWAESAKTTYEPLITPPAAAPSGAPAGKPVAQSGEDWGDDFADVPAKAEPVLAAPPPPPPPPPPAPRRVEPPTFAAQAPAASAGKPAPVAAPAPVAKKPPVNPFAELSAAKAEAAARPAAPVITDELLDQIAARVPRPPAPVVTDAMIEQIVARVLERMTDQVVRATVAEIVGDTAERLVREEIERMKSDT